jgi:hypothetical protein
MSALACDVKTELFKKADGVLLADSRNLGHGVLRACFENSSGGLAAGRGGWLRYSAVEDPRGIFSFVAPRHPRRPAAIPYPIYFQNTL